mgnify:CR=1 FL=1
MNSLNSLKGRNLTMLVDFYEMTMANGYLKNGMGDTVAYFDMFFRKVPDGGGYVIMAGIEQLCEYLKGLKFTPEDIEYLRVKGFSEEFLDYLADFKFSCDVYAVPEGTPIFPGEPIVTVKGPIMQAQFVETMFYIIYNIVSCYINQMLQLFKTYIIFFNTFSIWVLYFFFRFTAEFT